jgi:hypothetical protein
MRPMIAAVAASVAAALAVVLGLAAAGPVGVLVAAVALVQLLVVARWFGALDVSAAARSGALVGAAAAIGADLGVALRDDRRPLTPVTAVLGLAVLAALIQQLTRRDGRDRLTASMSATVALAAVVGLGSCYLGVQSSRDGTAFVAAGVAAAAVAVVAAALPGPAIVGAAVGLVAGVGAGAVVGGLSDLGPRTGGLVGLGCVVAAAVTAAVARRAVHPDPLVTAGLPLLLAAPVTFVLARLLAP